MGEFRGRMFEEFKLEEQPDFKALSEKRSKIKHEDKLFK